MVKKIDKINFAETMEAVAITFKNLDRDVIVKSIDKTTWQIDDLKKHTTYLFTIEDIGINMCVLQHDSLLGSLSDYSLQRIISMQELFNLFPGMG